MIFRSGQEKFLRVSRRILTTEALESRQLLTASMGWDGPGQGSAELTYHVANTPSGLSQAETDAAIDAALQAWSGVADITFTKTNQPGLHDSLDISFTPLDGPGGTLAQAYFPDDVNRSRIAGDIQFDTSENWEVGNALGRQAFDLVYVAVHEIGHALGLDHTHESGSVLAPSVSPHQSFTGLSAHDAADIQELYAAPVQSASKPESNTTEPTTSIPLPAPPEPTTPDAPTVQPPSTTPDFRAEVPQWRQRFHRWFRFRNWSTSETVTPSQRAPTASYHPARSLTILVIRPTAIGTSPTTSLDNDIHAEAPSRSLLSPRLRIQRESGQPQRELNQDLDSTPHDKPPLTTDTQLRFVAIRNLRWLNRRRG